MRKTINEKDFIIQEKQNNVETLDDDYARLYRNNSFCRGKQSVCDRFMNSTLSTNNLLGRCLSDLSSQNSALDSEQTLRRRLVSAETERLRGVYQSQLTTKDQQISKLSGK